MDKVLHDPKDPKLWELWYWVMQDFVHQPYVRVYPKAPKRVMGSLGEGLGFGGQGLGSDYEGPGALGF